ncbi:unnamed protein product [Coffea canephora]|uniref:Uncharacterized protein n=1 Tax=Coffea canephora TaxID=49390 RepID=A0A068V039_COFCA|nr:unnamed protein product [Coffea canephora]
MHKVLLKIPALKDFSILKKREVRFLPCRRPYVIVSHHPVVHTATFNVICISSSEKLSQILRSKAFLRCFVSQDANLCENTHREDHHS